MAVVAAVMTGQGTGAIATIQLFGDSAETVLKQIFKPSGNKPLEVVPGRILLGHVVDRRQIVDQVTIGCEGPCTFAINCHGNPLIVERIMDLLQRCGVELLAAGQLLTGAFVARGPHDPIAVEAKLALMTVKTIEGARIIAHQVEAGLSQKARRWQRDIDSASVEHITAEAERVLSDSEPARLIVSGCTIAMIGPPNTGKSTLLNALAGREKAIVTDIKGTTRDWVSAEIHLPPLAATVIDTAGLDSGLAAGDVDRIAQQESIDMVERADVILLVLDLSQPSAPLGDALLHAVAGRSIVTVLNKADLPRQIDPACLPQPLGQTVRISARLGTGIEELVHAVHSACGVVDFCLNTPVAFTDRQRHLLEGLRNAKGRQEIRGFVEKLLHGRPAV